MVSDDGNLIYPVMIKFQTLHLMDMVFVLILTHHQAKTRVFNLATQGKKKAIFIIFALKRALMHLYS